MSTHRTWHKSSRSSTQNACVELAVDTEQVSIRDTKRREAGMLDFTPDAFGGFLADVKAGRHDPS
jgi:hypothetical protein